jgi:hypothetical protein
VGLLATVAALRNAYGTLAATGASPESGLEDFAAFGRLMGLEEVEAFDARWAAWPDRKGEGPDGV